MGPASFVQHPFDVGDVLVVEGEVGSGCWQTAALDLTAAAQLASCPALAWP
jgi:hypothetical protein